MLLDRNRSFAEQFEGRELNIRPRMSTIILTCLDARVDPAHVFGLELGDAAVIRTAGGRITPGVLGDLAVLSVLAADLPGAGAGPPQLVISITPIAEWRVSPSRLSSASWPKGSA